MSNATAAAFTHTTYASAIAAVKKSKATAGTVTWDAGDGFTGRAYWCDWRKRVVVETRTPAGTVLH